MFHSSFIFFALTRFISSCHLTESQFECGPHGRFEYCVEDFPGCVVGCHCHPGYYFDTDSKICEPNIKLTKQYRHHYMLEESPIGTPINAPLPTSPTPTPTPQTNLDKKVDEIAKDTDELGDWLYNQFFKTIESQVINKTNAEKSKQLTRRSGGGPLPKKTKRKSRKSWKESKKKKGKVHGLRRKLLRITEDDSLFDSDSSSGSEDESSSASDSDSSDTTSESDSKKDDKKHGHRELIMFNRKPKPPLPSFIFLPHMDTPYYPPIGLPPPPVLPMYPMVPIPPMAPMPFPAPPYCAPDDKNDTSPSATTSAAPQGGQANTATATTLADTQVTHASPTPAATSADSEMTIADTDNITPDATNIEDKNPSAEPTGRKKLGIRRRKKPTKERPKSQNTLRNNIPNESRHHLMYKLREKLMRKNKISPMNNLMEHDLDEASPMMNDFPKSQEYLINKQMQLRAMEDGVPKLKDVDFKYLSELIHRANLNDTNKVPSHPPHPIAPYENINDMTNTGQVGRRSYEYNNVHPYPQEVNNFKQQRPRNLQTSGTDNAFYSNLGRQIATMIRNIDSRGEREVNIEIERSNPQITQTILSQNRYAPRSYWERSVRSPLHFFKDKYKYLNPSNEKLLNLENEVENAASTATTLSLHELENIINTMSKAQFQIEDKITLRDQNPSSTGLNVNLLPKSTINKDGFLMFNKIPQYINNFKSRVTHFKATEKQISTYTTETTDFVNKTEFHKYLLQVIPSDFGLRDLRKSRLLISTPLPPPLGEYRRDDDVIKSAPVSKTEHKKLVSDANYHIKPTRKPIIDKKSTTTINIPKRHHMEYLTYLNSVPQPSLPKVVSPKIPNMQYHSQIVNYKTLNYIPGADNHYAHDQAHASYPQQISTYSRVINKPVVKPFRPSYFHHELHHFDYFE